MNNIEKLPIEYYIEKRKWEQTFEFLNPNYGLNKEIKVQLRNPSCGLEVSEKARKIG